MSTTTLFALATALLLSAAPVLRADDIVVPDDVGTIQAAVNAANATDVIIVKPGTYSEAVTVDGKTNITIRSDKPSKAILTGVAQAFVVSNSDGITIEGFKIVETSGTSVSIGASSSDCTLENLEVVGAGGNGISSAGTGHVIDDCVVAGALLSGITFTGQSSVCVDSFVNGAGFDGILVTGIQQCVLDCTINNSGNNAIQLGTESVGTSGGLIAGNKISGGLGIAILVEAALDSVVRGNTVKDAAGDGLRANKAAAGLVVMTNKFQKVTGNGITIGNALAHVLDNKIIKAGDRGIHMAAASQPSRIVNNTVSASTNAGLAIDSDRSIITGNRVKKSGTFDVAETGEDNVFIDNKVKTIMPKDV